VAWVEAEVPDAVVLVTADHGEGLDDHCEEDHGIFLYDDTIRIPMIASAPGVIPPGVIPEQARTIDVAPTLLELAGLSSIDLGIGGSLGPLLKREGSPPDTVAYLESVKTKLFYGGTGLKGIRTKNWKFVWAPYPEVYDLVKDPGERANLAESRAGIVEGMRRELENTVREVLDLDLTSVEAANADEKTLEGLRSLGYVSGAHESAFPGPFEAEMHLVGNDPKDLVDVSMGARDIENGFYERGEAKLRRFFRSARGAQEPMMARLWTAAHQNYAKLWMIRRNYREAAGEYGKALEVDSSYSEAGWSRIYALNLSGDYALAESEGASWIEKHASDWRVRLHRGLALALLGRTEEARRELVHISEHAPREASALESARGFLARLGTVEEEGALLAYLSSVSQESSSAEQEP
jgi:tetratricopeptide (TPR) repeat protein